MFMHKAAMNVAISAAFISGALLAPGIAEACSCLQPSLTRSWHEATDTLKGEVLRHRTDSAFHYYEVEVQRPFSGCTEPGDLITVRAARSSAACGIQLVVGKEYLLTSSVTGDGDYEVNLCGYNMPWRQLSSADLKYLSNRPVSCDATGTLVCADGTDPVSCLVDPCTVTEECADADRCESNYCGGCTAEKYTAMWEPVCTPW